MSDNTLIHRGNLISVFREKVTLANHHHSYFDIVKHPGGAVIAAINERNEICLLKQWRHAVDAWIWELPAGCIEESENPLETAQRELEEEAGVIAADWQELGHILPSPGFCNEVLFLFLATKLSASTVNLDEAEQLDATWFALEKACQMARAGEITDAKTLACLFKLDTFKQRGVSEDPRFFPTHPCAD